MLARFRVLLPFLLHLREGDDTPPQRIQEGEYDISIQPLTRSQVNREDLNVNAEMPLSAIVNAMEPAVPPPRSGTVRIDGAPAIPVDLVEIRFAKDDFDRRPANQDPLLQLCYELANGLLQRIRAVARSFFVEPLDPRTTLWRIDYLNNDETPLPPDNLLVRARKGASFVSGGTIVNREVWQRAVALPVKFAPNRSLELLLDATGLMPRFGPSLVLAATALETRIAEVLDFLEGRNPLPGGLWQWINERGDYRKEPSTTEQFDVLLRVMSGRSLKDDAGLWEAFQNLRDARNSFVHEGVARVGRRREAVTVDGAGALIQQCWRILAWLDEFVPAERRALLPEVMAQVEFARVAIAPT